MNKILSLISQKNFVPKLLLLLTIANQSALADNLKNPGKDLIYAEKLVMSEHIEAATPLLERYVQSNPKDPKGWCLLGTCYLDQEMTDRATNRAQDCFKKSLALDPNFSTTYAKLALIAGMEGKYQEQVNLASRALACPKPDFKALRLRAIAYGNLHKDKEALADFEKYLTSGNTNSHSPKNLEAYMTFLENAGQYRKAISVLEELRAKEKNKLAFARTEARYWFKLQDSEKALELLGKALAQDPTNEMAYQDRAKIYESQGKLKLALKDWNKVIELIPNSRSYLERAKIHEKMGHPEKAKADRERANLI